MYFITLGKSIHEMKGRAFRSGEPAYVLDAAIPGHNTDEAGLIRVPVPMRSALLQVLHAGGHGKYRKQDVFFGNDEIMHQRNIRRLEPFFPYQLTVAIRDAEGNGISCQAVRFVTVKIQFPGVMVETGMGGHSLAA